MIHPFFMTALPDLNNNGIRAFYICRKNSSSRKPFSQSDFLPAQHRRNFALNFPGIIAMARIHR
ncbi:hypothetical protein SAMN04488122_1171 [Chitinophaga arvensicola]|uniref:Uncharacterized protein n=1 Tax=Chitinophaga arvensicola TaxID=29529 RepID=A0A1I0Q2D7_9BACT|nr:hypothetical protein SAMN04488122_1171 [Chitinophaga arvensicola]